MEPTKYDHSSSYSYKETNYPNETGIKSVSLSDIHEQQPKQIVDSASNCEFSELVKEGAVPSLSDSSLDHSTVQNRKRIEPDQVMEMISTYRLASTINRYNELICNDVSELFAYFPHCINKSNIEAVLSNVFSYFKTDQGESLPQEVEENQIQSLVPLINNELKNLKSIAVSDDGSDEDTAIYRIACYVRVICKLIFESLDRKKIYINGNKHLHEAMLDLIKEEAVEDEDFNNICFKTHTNSDTENSSEEMSDEESTHSFHLTKVMLDSINEEITKDDVSDLTPPTFDYIISGPITINPIYTQTDSINHDNSQKEFNEIRHSSAHSLKYIISD